jgi:hypothetical protein
MLFPIKKFINLFLINSAFQNSEKLIKVKTLATFYVQKKINAPYRPNFREKWHHIPHKVPYKRGHGHQLWNFFLTPVIKMDFF